jgi:hypothetical protein
MPPKCCSILFKNGFSEYMDASLYNDRRKKCPIDNMKAKRSWPATLDQKWTNIKLARLCSGHLAGW